MRRRGVIIEGSQVKFHKRYKTILGHILRWWDFPEILIGKFFLSPFKSLFKDTMGNYEKKLFRKTFLGIDFGPQENACKCMLSCDFWLGQFRRFKSILKVVSHSLLFWPLHQPSHHLDFRKSRIYAYYANVL